MSLYSLCAGWTRYIPDILVGLFFLITLIVSAKKGFIGCILGIVSSLVAVIVAVSFAGAFADGTGGLFGLQGSLTDTFEKTFLNMDGFSVDVSAVGLETALKEQNISAIVSKLVLKVAGNQEEIATGTTLASLLGEAIASLTVRLIAGLLLFILVKIVVRLLKRILKGLVDKIPLLGGVNRVLGGVFGLLYAWVVVSALLAVLAVIPITGITAFFERTLFVGFLYEHNGLVYILSWFI